MRTEFLSLEDARKYLTQEDVATAAPNNRVKVQAALRLLEVGMRRALTQRQQDCVRLYYFEGMTMEAVGETLGIGKATVCRHLRRSREKLESFFELAGEIQEKQRSDKE